MTATIRCDDKMRRGQCHDLIAHTLDGAESAVQHKHWRSGAICFIINTDVVDIGTLAAMRFTRNKFPHIESKPTMHWSIGCIDCCTQHCCNAYQSKGPRLS